MRILTRFVGPDSELLRTIHAKRHLQRSAFYLVIFAFSLNLGSALAVVRRAFSPHPFPRQIWFTVFGPLCLLLLALIHMFRVERLYRKVGL